MTPPPSSPSVSPSLHAGGQHISEPPRAGWFFNPYVQIAISILLSAASQLCLKKGANKSVVREVWMGIEALRSGWVWLGILCMVSSLLSWLYALRYVPLNIAYNLTGLIQVLVPLSCWFFLGEHLSATRMLGILLVLAGVYTVARPLMTVGERL